MSDQCKMCGHYEYTHYFILGDEVQYCAVPNCICRGFKPR